MGELKIFEVRKACLIEGVRHASRMVDEYGDIILCMDKELIQIN